MSGKTTHNGVKIEFIGKKKFESLSTLKKVRMILDRVRDGKIVVLEKGLAPDEESELVEATMREIDPDSSFSGIEVEQQRRSQQKRGGLMNKLLGKADDHPMTIIGPAGQLEAVSDGDDILNAIVRSQ